MLLQPFVFPGCPPSKNIVQVLKGSVKGSQVWRLFKLKSAHEISLTFSLCFVIGIAFWLVYGILNGLMSVIIWNGIALILGCGIFFAKMKWGR